MDTTFWSGLVLGAVLSLAASIVANLYTENIRGWITTKKGLRRLRELSKEKEDFQTIKELRADPLQLQVVPIATALATLMLMLISLMFFILSVFFDVPGTIPRLSLTPENWKPIIRALAFYFCGANAFLFLAFSLRLLSSFLEDVRRLMFFDEYRAQLKERWPEEDWN